MRSVSIFAPSIPVRLPQSGGTTITQVDRVEPDMIDPGRLIAQFEEEYLNEPEPERLVQRHPLGSFGLGDKMPYNQPFFKIPWIEAMLGCPIKMTEGQIWVDHETRDIEDIIRQGGHIEHTPWFHLYVEFLTQLQQRFGERFPISGQTLLRGPSDLAAALLGVEETCIGWLKHPQLMARLMRMCTDANLAVLELSFDMLEPFCGGYISEFGILAPEPVLRTQADHSTLLSPSIYEKQILPYDLEVIRAYPFSIFHIHNNGLHIAPLLVEIPELSAIEVMVDPYPTSERKLYEVEMLQKIQEHKPLILDVNCPDLREAEWLLRQLSPCGLCFNPGFSPATFQAVPPDMPGNLIWELNP